MVLIAVSGYGQEETLNRSREAGFDDYAVKPIDLDKLNGLMRRTRRRDWAQAGSRRGWHAAKLRLTGILFPIGFPALVWAGSPDLLVICDRVSPCLRPLACHPQTTGRPSGDRSSSTASVDRRGPPLMPRAELGIHGLRSWGRNLSRKVRETRSSSSLQGHEGGTGPPTFGRPGSVVGPQRPLRRWSPAPRPLPPSGNGFVFRLDSALVRPKSQYVND